ncbi:ATP-grasp domain-containing protein [Ruminococcus sp.]|uniref:ATP-grasp domain-containing protein n=1 Tax=Ruminococcus sp. TaxID=41978 RepID=UPI0025DC7933|nr:ATP-grasp domain-containing protein [Ruminococcus sp.]MBQ9541698.1 ATP-grasp domain-containing protein [Ruminococcus sp.]
MELKGKRLLILGATNVEIEIINEAKKLGVYTIVTDNHTDWSLAPAKYVADEAYDISWSDIDALEKICRDRNVDGCLAGYSERRVECLTALCKRMGFYCYTEDADLEVIFSKDKFREACVNAGIPATAAYSINDENIVFPVIVKPVDNAGSRGVSVCKDRDELNRAYEAACNSSVSGRAIIEEFLDGDDPRYEPVFFYTIHNGTATLSNSLDRIMVDFGFGGGMIKQAVGNVYPSKYLDGFMEKQDRQFRELFSSLGMKNGCALMQGKMKNGSFVCVDLGFRLEGSLSFHYSDFINGMNVVQMMIRHALTGTMGDDRLIDEKDDPRFAKHGVTVTLLATKGTIASISGLDEISREKCVIYVSQKMREGTVCTRLADYSQVFGRIYLCSDNKQELIRTIDKIYSTVKVLDEDGNNMLIGRYDANELK